MSTEDAEPDNEVRNIWQAYTTKDQNFAVSSIAHSLLRIARAQEALVALSTADLEAAIEAEIENRSQVKADEIAAQATKRSFLGKKT